MEIWKDITGFGNTYQVSNFGRVRSRFSKNGKLIQNYSIMKQKILFGYCIVTLARNTISGDKAINKRVHRLVAEEFIEKVFGKDIINHKDGNKQNNVYTNLEWCTSKENNLHALRTGLRKVDINQLNKAREKALAKTSSKIIDTSNSKIYSSINQCARENNFNYSTLYNMLKGIRVNTTNFRFL